MYIHINIYIDIYIYIYIVYSKARIKDMTAALRQRGVQARSASAERKRGTPVCSTQAHAHVKRSV